MSNYNTSKRIVKDYLFSKKNNKIGISLLILFWIIASGFSILEPLFI